MKWLQSMLRRLRGKRDLTQHWVQRPGVSGLLDLDAGSLDGISLGANINGLSHLGAGASTPDGATLYFPYHGIWIEQESGRLVSIRVAIETTAPGTRSDSFLGGVRWRGRTVRASDLRTVSDVEAIGGSASASDCDRDETVLTYVAGSHVIEFEINHAGIGSMITVSMRHREQG